MMTMMKRNRERPLVESSKLWDRRQQSCVIRNVEAESAATPQNIVTGYVTVSADLNKTSGRFLTFNSNSAHKSSAKKLFIQPAEIQCSMKSLQSAQVGKTRICEITVHFPFPHSSSFLALFCPLLHPSLVTPSPLSSITSHPPT